MCDYEKAIDNYVNEIRDTQKSVDRAYKQEIKLEFQRVIGEDFYEAVNDFIDKENEFTEGQRKIVEHIWKHLKEKINNT